jgi:hypothetical protein
MSFMAETFGSAWGYLVGIILAVVIIAINRKL